MRRIIFLTPFFILAISFSFFAHGQTIKCQNPATCPVASGYSESKMKQVMDLPELYISNDLLQILKNFSKMCPGMIFSDVIITVNEENEGAYQECLRSFKRSSLWKLSRAVDFLKQQAGEFEAQPLERLLRRIQADLDERAKNNADYVLEKAKSEPTKLTKTELEDLINYYVIKKSELDFKAPFGSHNIGAAQQRESVEDLGNFTKQVKAIRGMAEMEERTVQVQIEKIVGQKKSECRINNENETVNATQVANFGAGFIIDQLPDGRPIVITSASLVAGQKEITIAVKCESCSAAPEQVGRFYGNVVYQKNGLAIVVIDSPQESEKFEFPPGISLGRISSKTTISIPSYPWKNDIKFYELEFPEGRQTGYDYDFQETSNITTGTLGTVSKNPSSKKETFLNANGNKKIIVSGNPYNGSPVVVEDNNGVVRLMGISIEVNKKWPQKLPLLPVKEQTIIPIEIISDTLKSFEEYLKKNPIPPFQQFVTSC